MSLGQYLCRKKMFLYGLFEEAEEESHLGHLAFSIKIASVLSK